MIRIKHKVKPCIYGLGLFIDQPLHKGLLILDNSGLFTAVLRLSDYPVMVQEHLHTYGYTGKDPYHLPEGMMYYNTDDSRFMNHSEDPSCIYSPSQEIYIASRNLEVGDELTCNYNDFCDRGMYGFSF